jgi:N-acetylmuramoyl-L-alanine amidase
MILKNRQTFLIFLLAVAVAYDAARAAEAPAQAEQGGDRAPVKVEVDAKGMVLQFFGDAAIRVWGPPAPGELSLWGALTPGLLDPRTWADLTRTVPGLPARLAEKGRYPISHERLIVVLDPGHGGDQKGTVGHGGTIEKTLVLKVAEKVKAVLAGVPNLEVIMTRQRDEEVSLWDRVAIANQVGAHLFISIHANSYPRASMRGVETYFHSVEASGDEAKRVASTENASAEEDRAQAVDPVGLILEDMHQAERLRDSERLAQHVQDQMARLLPFENLGVGQADFIVLRGSRMPAVLVEMGFLSNRQEERALREAAVQDKLAEAIRAAVVEFWELLRQKEGGAGISAKGAPP